jgi:hypothetical protein
MKTIDSFVDWYNNGEFIPLVNFDAESYSHSINQHVKSKFYGEKPREYIGASALAHPSLQLALKKLGFPESDDSKFSVRTMMIFHFGNVFEELIVHLMQAYGLKVGGTQLELRHGEFMGHIDGIVNDNCLIEVKTMSPDYFKNFTEKPDDIRGYYTQLSFYYEALKDKGITDCGWLCFDKGTFTLKFVRPDMNTLEYYWCRTKEKMYYISITNQLEDILKFALPDCREEVYKGQGTGRYLLPSSMRRCSYTDCFFNTYQARDNYKKTKTYVDVNNPPSDEEVISRLLQRKEEIEKNSLKPFVDSLDSFNVEF